jgi:flagellar hook-associated protein 1 FlgK
MNVALTGLFTAQRNMDTIAHNTANIQTNGYSRQSTVQSAASPIRLFNKTGMVGTGVNVLSVARIRDLYLDQKIWYQKTIQGEWTQKAGLVDQIQFRISGGADGMGAEPPFSNALGKLAASVALI